MTDNAEKKTITDVSEYVKDFIDKRFPGGIQGDMFTIMSEIIVDAFHDGARWAEATRNEESRIILP